MHSENKKDAAQWVYVCVEGTPLINFKRCEYQKTCRSQLLACGNIAV